MFVVACDNDDQKLIPTREHYGDAGMDLRSNETIDVHPGTVVKVDCGIRIVVPYGYAGLAFSRSGHGKCDIRVKLSNSVGVIDHQYRGKVSLLVENNGNEDFHIKKYDRIGQLVIAPVWVVDASMVPNQHFDSTYANTTRGSAGFGSTGIK